MAKTLKLKRPGTEAADENGEDAAAPAPRLSPPEMAPPPSASYKVAGILAILATLMFLGLIAVQFLELNYYAAPPSVWPTAGMF